MRPYITVIDGQPIDQLSPEAAVEAHRAGMLTILDMVFLPKDARNRVREAVCYTPRGEQAVAAQ